VENKDLDTSHENLPKSSASAEKPRFVRSRLFRFAISTSAFILGLAISLAAAFKTNFIAVPTQSILFVTQTVEENATFKQLAALFDSPEAAALPAFGNADLGPLDKFDGKGSAADDVESVTKNDALAKSDSAAQAVLNAEKPPEKTTEKKANPIFNRDLVLDDSQHRIAEDFQIPAGLRERVGFWFDIYSKYDSNQRIVHHSRFPWIVYKVVDVAPIINAETPRHRWLRNEKADKYVKSETRKIKEALVSISRRKNMDNLNEYETLVANALSKLNGPVKRLAREATGETRVQVGQRDFFQAGLEISPRYLAGMEDIFRSQKLPIELTRIPFVESSFNKTAYSKVGACGVWQFMGGTGRKFMIVDDRIDERRSPFKATEAAARLLKENHLILHHSWPLAITAWNHGPPGVRKAMRAAHNEDLAVIVAKYHSKSFDFASSNFYSEFLAALHAERYNDQIFSDLNRQKVIEAFSARLAHSISAKALYKRSGLSLDDFNLLNPDLEKAVARNASVPRGFKLMITEPAKAGLASLLRPGSIEDRKAVAELTSTNQRIQ
jgi:membrane-bound lytic murein transglycosylase D